MAINKYKESELTFYAKNIDLVTKLSKKVQQENPTVLKIINKIKKSNHQYEKFREVRTVDKYEVLKPNVIYIVFLNLLSQQEVDNFILSNVEYYFVLNELDLINKLIIISKKIYTENEGEKYKSFYEENKNLLEHNISELNEIIEKGTSNLTLDINLKILKSNKKFTEMFEDKDKQLVGRGFYDLIHPNEPEIIREEIKHKINNGAIWEGRMNLVNSKGKSIFTIVSIIPLTNNNGETTGFKVLLNEITELIKFLTLLEDENEAVQEQNAENSKTMFRNTKQAAMGELISMIAHQWRQPLSTISLIVSDLMLKTAFGMYDANYFMNAFKKMEGHVEYMSITIDDFRNFFKPNKQKEIFELGTVLNNAQKIMKDVLENNGVFYKEQSLSGIKLFTYKSELLQVFINLIKNAKDVVVERKITNPYIKVSTKKSKGNVIIVFEDNAGGIPLKIIDKIFEPYFSTKDEKNGTGLGLSMSKTIIEDHMGGKIKVSNTVVGAKFEIELPIYVVGNQ